MVHFHWKDTMDALSVEHRSKQQIMCTRDREASSRNLGYWTEKIWREYFFRYLPLLLLLIQPKKIHSICFWIVLRFQKVQKLAWRRPWCWSSNIGCQQVKLIEPWTISRLQRTFWDTYGLRRQGTFRSSNLQLLWTMLEDWELTWTLFVTNPWLTRSRWSSSSCSSIVVKIARRWANG